MSKQITDVQLRKLRDLRTQLITPNIDIRIGAIVHINQILKDIDFLSTFTSNLSTELSIYKNYREDYNFETIIQIINNAINYYEG